MTGSALRRLAIVAAAAALDDDDWVKGNVARIRATRERLVEGCRTAAGLDELSGPRDEAAGRPREALRTRVPSSSQPAPMRPRDTSAFRRKGGSARCPGCRERGPQARLSPAFGRGAGAARLGSPGAARDLAERALGIRERKALAADVAESRFVLARALWALGEDRARALELAETALAELDEAVGPALDTRDEVETWLRARRR